MQDQIYEDQLKQLSIDENEVIISEVLNYARDCQIIDIRKSMFVIIKQLIKKNQDLFDSFMKKRLFEPIQVEIKNVKDANE